MEALAEQIVTTYLTRGGKVFIVPQYAIAAPTGKGDWACPDIVALDFGAKEVVVVEVATGVSLDGLTKRVAERQTRWFDPIRAKLTSDGLVEQAGWEIRFLGFVAVTALKPSSGRLSGRRAWLSKRSRKPHFRGPIGTLVLPRDFPDEPPQAPP